jgi:hypothetical protein
MNYDNAKDAFDELKNLDGKISFKGENTLIDYFVLLPTATMDDFVIEDFLDQYTTSGSFEVEGNHDEPYTIIAINAVDKVYNNDTDYFQRMLVGG